MDVKVTVAVDEVDSAAGVQLLDEIASWEDVRAEVPESSESGFITEAVFLISLIVVGIPNAIVVLTRTVKYVQDNFHRPVLIDFSDGDPKVIALPSGPGMRGRTFIKNQDGQIELAPNIDAPNLSDELAILLKQRES